MTGILTDCPLWCAGDDTPDPLAPDARFHRSAGTTVALSSREGKRVRLSLSRDDYLSDPASWDSITLLMFEVLHPATLHDPATTSIAAVSVGAALRYSRLLRVAVDELAVETMYGAVCGYDEPDFRFVVKGMGRESTAPALGCVRHVLGGVPMARLELGDLQSARAEVVAGLAELRELITAIEREAAGLLDGAGLM